MQDRTRAYLRGRFGDHYRRVSLDLPPSPEQREWGFIPWTSGPGTTMVRHRSLLDIGDVEGFLQRKRPRHAYFSAGYYDDPGAGSMGEKGWRAADLVFDLDADHLPRVDPEEDSYAEMLAVCKDALVRLLDFLTDDFGFEDLEVAFSGGRGYHVHVRDEGVRPLGREERREVVDYVRGVDVTFERLLETEAVAGMGRQTPAEKRTLKYDGGWGKRVHERLMALVDEVNAMDEDAAMARLQEFDGIGEGSATKLVTVFDERYDELAAGNVDVHGRVATLARVLTEDTVASDTAPIDEPVTTDINRLIRLPGSLHGGSGLQVTRIDRDDVADFDPLADAIPETFRGNEIAVEVTDGGEVELDGVTFTVPAGAQTLPEYLGVFLMTRGRAEKVSE
jgi:DNA primase small subunit